MAEFRQDLQSLKPSPPFPEMCVNMELVNQFAELSPSMLENFNLSVETFLAHQQLQQQLFPPNNISISLHPDSLTTSEDVFPESKKRKVIEGPSSSSPSASGFGGNSNTNPMKNKSLGKEKEGSSKSEEVVHVRARRGQATDSHSLAERVRRAKINNRMKCLQNLVPGCQKTMGMAGMLDEIINYVHSLKNQVELLSMELASASSHDFNKLDTLATKKVQGTNSHEEWARERYGDHSWFQSTWPL